jgi:hypothetical protein
MNTYRNYQKEEKPMWTKQELVAWRKSECNVGNHLWVEVIGIEKHYLYCEGCGKISYDLTIEVKVQNPIRGE